MKTTGNQESNYEKVFDQFREWFLQCPQENIAKKVGAEFDTENLYLPFFGERCRINRTTGEITGAGQRQIPVTERLTIMHHLAVLPELCRRRKKNGAFPGNPGSGSV